MPPERLLGLDPAPPGGAVEGQRPGVQHGQEARCTQLPPGAPPLSLRLVAQMRRGLWETRRPRRTSTISSPASTRSSNLPIFARASFIFTSNMTPPKMYTSSVPCTTLGVNQPGCLPRLAISSRRCGNRNFKGYFGAIGKVPKRLRDVNHASQRSEDEGGQAARRAFPTVVHRVFPRIATPWEV